MWPPWSWRRAQAPLRPARTDVQRVSAQRKSVRASSRWRVAAARAMGSAEQKLRQVGSVARAAAEEAEMPGIAPISSGAMGQPEFAMWLRIASASPASRRPDSTQSASQASSASVWPKAGDTSTWKSSTNPRVHSPLIFPPPKSTRTRDVVRRPSKRAAHPVPRPPCTPNATGPRPSIPPATPAGAPAPRTTRKRGALNAKLLNPPTPRPCACQSPPT